MQYIIKYNQQGHTYIHQSSVTSTLHKMWPYVYSEK